MHTFVKSNISSFSVAFDDQNPNLFALQIYMKNGQSITPLYATKREFIEFMKKGIEKNWNTKYETFDMQIYAQNVVKKMQELKLDKGLFYNFDSISSMMIEINKSKEGKTK